MFNDTEKYFMIFLCVCLFIGTQFNLRFQKKNHYRQCQRPRWTNKIYFRNTSNPHCLINCALSCSFTIQKKERKKRKMGSIFASIILMDKDMLIFFSWFFSIAFDRCALNFKFSIEKHRKCLLCVRVAWISEWVGGENRLVVFIETKLWSTYDEFVK